VWEGDSFSKWAERDVKQPKWLGENGLNIPMIIMATGKADKTTLPIVQATGEKNNNNKTTV